MPNGMTDGRSEPGIQLARFAHELAGLTHQGFDRHPQSAQRRSDSTEELIERVRKRSETVDRHVARANPGERQSMLNQSKLLDDGDQAIIIQEYVAHDQVAI